MKKTKVIAIANQKGGIGKTTTATTMASMLSEKGYKTLLIDADPQRNSTATYGAQSDGVATLFDVLAAKERIPLYEAIQHTDYGDIVASDKLMRDADIIFLQDSTNGIYRLQDAISEYNTTYDYIIIDTNPTIDRIMYNALVAADEVIIPISATMYGFMGLGDLLETIREIQKRPNKNLKVKGILIVAYKGQTLFAKDVKKDLAHAADMIGTKLFSTKIRESIRVPESQARNIPLGIYAPKSTSAIDYRAFIDEYLDMEE